MTQLRRYFGELSIYGMRNQENEIIESVLKPCRQKRTPSRTYPSKLRLITTRGRMCDAALVFSEEIATQRKREKKKERKRKTTRSSSREASSDAGSGEAGTLKAKRRTDEKQRSQRKKKTTQKKKKMRKGVFHVRDSPALREPRLEETAPR